jgi:hypothetical protein
MLAILGGQHVLVESGMPNLGSCATPLVPELLGGNKPINQVIFTHPTPSILELLISAKQPIYTILVDTDES